jgi:hypothetical protein
VVPQALRVGSNDMRSLFGPEQLVARRPSNTAQPTERAVKVIRTARREGTSMTGSRVSCNLADQSVRQAVIVNVTVRPLPGSRQRPFD